MTTPKETLWELDPHTQAKHEILRRYLAAWFPILGTYHSRIVSIAGFSGPGRYKNGELCSPTVAAARPGGALTGIGKGGMPSPGARMAWPAIRATARSACT